MIPLMSFIGQTSISINVCVNGNSGSASLESFECTMYIMHLLLMNISVRIYGDSQDWQLRGIQRPSITNCRIDNGAAIWISSSVETNIGIIFTCMHAMRPILSRLVPGFFSSTSASSNNRDTQSWQKSEDSRNGRFNALFRSFIRPARLNHWPTSTKESKQTSHNTSGFNADANSVHSTVEMSNVKSDNRISPVTGTVDSHVMAGATFQTFPTDKMMYAKEVEVVSDDDV
jgi:hypothetical protein